MKNDGSVSVIDRQVMLSPLSDLAGISEQHLVTVKVLAQSIRHKISSLKKLQFEISEQLTMLQDLIGSSDFYKFCHSEFGISESKARRHITAYKLFLSHFGTDGRIDMEMANSFTQSAVLALGDDTSDDVIAEIRLLATDGKKIDEATVRKILDERRTIDDKLVAVEAEKNIIAERLSREKEKHELSVARLETQLKNQEELARRARTEAEELEAEIERLNAQETQVIEKEVQVVPAQYASLEIALADANKKLQSKLDEITAAKGECSLIEEKAKELKESFSLLEAAASDVTAFKNSIDNSFLKMPISRLQALANVDAGILSQLTMLGDELIAKGELLRNLPSKLAA